MQSITLHTHTIYLITLPEACRVGMARWQCNMTSVDMHRVLNTECVEKPRSRKVHLEGTVKKSASGSHDQTKYVGKPRSKQHASGSHDP